jgi:hypothetical protein
MRLRIPDCHGRPAMANSERVPSRESKADGARHAAVDEALRLSYNESGNWKSGKMDCEYASLIRKTTRMGSAFVLLPRPIG